MVVAVLGSVRLRIAEAADLSSGPFPFLYQPAECHMLSFVHASAAMHVGAQMHIWPLSPSCSVVTILSMLANLPINACTRHFV